MDPGLVKMKQKVQAANLKVSAAFTCDILCSPHHLSNTVLQKEVLLKLSLHYLFTLPKRKLLKTLLLQALICLLLDFSLDILNLFIVVKCNMLASPGHFCDT